jgi:hypothetical protein
MTMPTLDIKDARFSRDLETLRQKTQEGYFVYDGRAGQNPEAEFQLDILTNVFMHGKRTVIYRVTGTRHFTPKSGDLAVVTHGPDTDKFLLLFNVRPLGSGAPNPFEAFEALAVTYMNFESRYEGGFGYNGQYSYEADAKGRRTEPSRRNERVAPADVVLVLA